MLQLSGVRPICVPVGFAGVSLLCGTSLREVAFDQLWLYDKPACTPSVCVSPCALRGDAEIDSCASCGRSAASCVQLSWCCRAGTAVAGVGMIESCSLD